MTLIVRAYSTEKKARDAAKKLKAEGFGEDSICVLAPKAEEDTAADVADAVRGGHLPRSYAEAVTKDLKDGRCVASVNAVFGHGQDASLIMESFGPVETYKALLATDDKRFTSDGWAGLPLILQGRRFFLFSGELAPSTSRTKLSDNAAPLSSRLGIKLLKDQKKDWKTSFGMPLLTSKQYILGEPKLISKRHIFGEPKLNSNRHIFGEPNISKEAGPFSKLFGWALLTK